MGALTGGITGAISSTGTYLPMRVIYYSLRAGDSIKPGRKPDHGIKLSREAATAE